MKKIFKCLFPRHSVIPLLVVLAFNMITYYGTKYVNLNRYHHDISTLVNVSIPFVPFFFLFYFIAYIQWVIGFILIARENRQICYRYMSGELIAKIITFVIFLIIPTTMIRPEIIGNGFFDKLVEFLYRIDTPRNLFPSMHCLESWLCFRGALKLKSIRKWYAPLSLIITLLVFASTILIKQHVPLDIIGGILVVEIGLLVSKLTKADKLFDTINTKLKLTPQK